MKKGFVVLLTGLMALASAHGQAADAPRKTIGVLIFDKVLTSDVTAPLEVFGNAAKQEEFSGYRVVAIAPEKKPVTTEEGVVLMPQYSIDDAPALDTLIVGSAYDMKPVLDNAKLIKWVAQQGGQAAWLASNCSGARILGDAGLLVGRRATTYPGGELLMKARYLRTTVVFGEKVVVDGNLVTSNGGLVGYTAALKLLERMSSAAFAQKVAGNIYYDRVASAFTPASSSMPASSPVPPTGKTGATVMPLMKKALADAAGRTEGKEAEMIVVEYAPGGSTPTHRHDAHVFVYVLEGSLVMQLAGQPEVVLQPGQTFYENPGDVHVKSANASTTQPAKFLVVLVKDKAK